MHRLAVFDIDGVLADERHRTQHALNKSWGVYFHPDNVKKDKVWKQGRQVYEAEVLVGSDIAYLTGRGEQIRRVTEKWLKKKEFDHKAPLIMRQPQHRTSCGWPLPRLKRMVLTELSYVYDRVSFYEDDPAVCEAASDIPNVDVRHCTWHVKPEALVRRAVA